MNLLSDILKRLKPLEQGLSSTISNNIVKPVQQSIYNYGVSHPQQTAQILQAPKQLQNAAINIGKFAVTSNPIISHQLPNIPKIDIPEFKTGGWGTDLVANNLIRPVAESLINTPHNLIKGSNLISEGMDKQQIKPLLQGVGYAGEGALNLGTFGTGTVAKSLIKPGVKLAVKQGAKTGAAIGAGFGGSQFLQSGNYNAIDFIKDVAGGAIGGAVLGGGAGALGGIVGKLTTRTPKVEAQLRDLQGRWVAGNKPVKPAGMPKAQWDFQINFNKKYGRNPYTPVYADDLNRAFKYETEKRGAGLSVRDVNKDRNPLGVANATIGDKKPFVNLLGDERPRVRTQASIRADVNTNLAKTSRKTPLEELQAKTTPEQSSRQNPALPFGDIIDRSGIKVKDKVNIIDYLRTPNRVLEKIGLKTESDLIRKKYDDYLVQLPQEIDKITRWSKRVSPDANRRIFQYLDGQGIKLSGEELKVATEIKSYLKDWADKLRLPEDKRISSYITHIFDKDFVQKEFDPEIASLIRDRIPGSVYDPFVEQRLGKTGYIEDTWRALDAYVKRATRKVNMDEALEGLSMRASNLEDSQFNYVKKYVDKINMRPSNLDNLIDNTIKSVIGYKLGQRPMASVSRTLRQMVYRGTLGLNVGSALRNLTQGANTYAKLGEKYTLKGYYNIAKAISSGSDELERVGVLRDNLVQDRTISATGKFWESLDKGLWAFFQAAEKINRGAAYFGAKAQAIDRGLSEAEAIQFAKNIVRDTQFTFGSVDTPQVLQSDIAKTLLQFQSFNVKQAEFLTEMAKSKDFAGLLRFSMASTAMLYTIGELIGMRPTDFIPFYGVATGETKLGETPPVKLVADQLKTQDDYGNPLTTEDRLRTLGNDLVPFIPAGVQARKTINGLLDTQRGYTETKGGNVKFPVSQDSLTRIRAGVFGTNNLPEARNYYNNNIKPLSENQSNIYRNQSGKKGFYDMVLKTREDNKKEDQLKEQVKQGGSATSGDKIYYNDGNEVKSVDLTPPTKGNGIDAFVNSDWKYTKARELWKAKDNIDPQQFEQALQKLGVSKEEVRYDYIANHENDIKLQYILSKNLSHEQLIERLVTGRYESVSGKRFASDGVLDDLYKRDLISKAERDALKKLDLDKNGKNLSKATGGLTPSKLSSLIGKLKVDPISLPRVKTTKYSYSKPSKRVSKKYTIVNPLKKKVKKLA